MWADEEKRPFLNIGVALCLSLAIATVLFVLGGGENRSTMRESAFTVVLQFIGVALLGTAIGATFRNQQEKLQQRREDADKVAETEHARKEFQKADVGRVGDAYRLVKEARRVLRAGGLTDTYGDPPGSLSEKQLETYDQVMVTISKAQHALDALCVEIDAFDEEGNLKQLVRTLKAMERYLSDLITEHERVRPNLSLAYAELKELNRFTRDKSESVVDRDSPDEFLERFRSPYRIAIRELARSVDIHPLLRQYVPRLRSAGHLSRALPLR